MQKKPSRKKAVMTQVVGGYLNTVISITQGLLLLPIYFKFIDFATYGYWITITSIIAILGIINFGIGNMVTQRISSSYAKRNFQAVADYFINSQFLYYIIASSLFAIGLVFSYWLETILSLDDAQLDLLTKAYLIALVTATLTILSGSIKGFSQALLKPLFGVYSTVFSRIGGIILTVILLYQDIGLLSIPLGLLVTEILILFSNSIYAYYEYKKLNTKSYLQKNIIFEYLHFSPHLFGLMVGNTLSNKSHPLIITTFLGAEMTTAYAVTRKAIEIIDQTINTFNSSLIGPFSHLVGEGDIEKTKKISVKIISLSFFAVLIAFGTYMATNHLFVSLWISEEIALSQEIMGFGAIAYSMTFWIK
jgi:O-antigen/teichoic acid export membrane protein